VSVERELVQYVRETSFEDLPDAAVDAARREILWTLGTSVAGAAAAGSREVVAFARQLGGRPEATVLGFGDQLPASVAGFANGCFAKALEYEDKLWIDAFHGYAIGTAVVPAAFGVAEHLGGRHGRAVLTAIALATDVEGRMIKAVHNAIESGWNSTYLYSALGAAIAAGKLLDLTEEEFLNALGLAYSQTTGNRQAHVEGVLGVRMQMGFGVRNGVVAAQLAKLGITGVKQFLTGQFGLYPLYFKDKEIDLASLTRDFGRRFEGTRLGFKAYPCGAVVHPALDAVLALVDDGIDIAAIESVQVYGTPRLWIMVEPRELRQNPKTHADAEFSLPWAVACVMIDRRLSLSHYSEEALRDQRYLELARKVETEMDAGRAGVHVEIVLRNGQRLRSPTVTVAKGHPDNPQSTTELVERFRDCLDYAPRPLPRDRTERAKDLVLDLQRVPDAAEVVRLLCPAGED
jgi:2-methylcitrate dehydratase PrpD